MKTLHDDWEFNVLGIYNYKKSGPFDALFDFVRKNHDKIDGDIVESGVYRGKSLVALAMLLKELGSDKKVYGYDSFAGFPPVYHESDKLEAFYDLARNNKITTDHLAAVERNKEWRALMSGQQQTVENISSSGDFSGTSLSLVQRKIELMELDNIVLVDGPFHETMTQDAAEPKTIMAVLMDCDLYQSYHDTFSFVWPRMADGAMIYLDEYYSLKFPGARVATDEFLVGKQASLEQHPQEQGDFERWYIRKAA
jgi:hypothetical protein